MRISASIACLVLLVTGCGVADLPTGNDDEEVGVEAEWEEYSIDGLSGRRAQAGITFLEAAADSVFRMGLLHGDPGVSIGLVTHVENVIYYVGAGDAEISTEDAAVAVAPGSVVFVRGGVEHRFRAITSELDVVAVFSQRSPVPQDPAFVSYTLEEMVASRVEDRTAWSPLIDSSAMSVGMLMLPKGGIDDPLVHAFDEFKIVVRGGGRFDVGSGGLEASPGSIAHIGAGVRHGFRRISDDLDVLVIWAR